MRRERVHLSRRHQAWVYGSLGLLLVTGGVWLVARRWLGGAGELGEATSPLAAASMKVHGAAAMVALIVLGSVLPGHVQRAWKARMSRATGAVLLAANAVLIASGYALYYAGDEWLRAIASPLHWVVGLLLPVAMGAHLWERRRLPAQTRSRGPVLVGAPAQPRRAERESIAAQPRG
jgi:hypothetical protein